MIDHLYRLSSEAEAKEVFGVSGELPHGIATMIYVDGMRCDILPVDLVMQDAVYSEDGENVQPRTRMPGYWFTARSTGRVTLPGSPRMVTDNERAAARQPYVVSAAAGLDLAVMRTVLRIEPVFAGDDYPPISGLGPASFI